MPSTPITPLTAKVSSPRVLRSRRELQSARRIVVKAGTSLVVEQGYPSLRRLSAIVEQISFLISEGREVLFVCSGAVGFGRNVARNQLIMNSSPADRLRTEGWSDPPRNSAPKPATTNAAPSAIHSSGDVHKSVAAAMGQAHLSHLLKTLFAQLNVNVSEMLLTSYDFKTDGRREATVNTLATTMSLGIVPIVNENDAVSPADNSDVIFFDDNDSLAGIIAQQLGADLLVLLTDVDGVYDKPPTTPGAAVIPTFAPNRSLAFGPKSKTGRGGMESKVSSASRAVFTGVPAVVVGNGRKDRTLIDIVAGKQIGTLFVADPSALQETISNSLDKDAVSAISTSVKAASRALQLSTAEYRSGVLKRAAEALEREVTAAQRSSTSTSATGKESNNLDRQRCIGVLRSCASDLRQLSESADPLDVLLSKMEVSDGVVLEKKTTPVGTILAMFESSPADRRRTTPPPPPEAPHSDSSNAASVTATHCHVDACASVVSLRSTDAQSIFNDSLISELSNADTAGVAAQMVAVIGAAIRAGCGIIVRPPPGCDAVVHLLQTHLRAAFDSESPECEHEAESAEKPPAKVALPVSFLPANTDVTPLISTAAAASCLDGSGRGLVDLTVPYGSSAFVTEVRRSSSVPTLGSGSDPSAVARHVYIHDSADIDDAVKVLLDLSSSLFTNTHALSQNRSGSSSYKALGCMQSTFDNGAADTVLLDVALVNDGRHEPLLRALRKAGVSLYGTPRAVSEGIIDAPCDVSSKNHPSKTSSKTSDKKSLLVDIVSGVAAAVAVCNGAEESQLAVTSAACHGARGRESHWCDAIVCNSDIAKREFLSRVDAACVFANVCPQLAAASAFGLGPEVARSVSKIHSRGPVGVDAFLSAKWVMSDVVPGRCTTTTRFANGDATFTHKSLPL